MNYLPGEDLDNFAHLGLCVLARVTWASTVLQGLANPKPATRKNSQPLIDVLAARQDMFLCTWSRFIPTLKSESRHKKY